MSASRARRLVLLLIFSLSLVMGLVPVAAAADAAPVPTSMAAIGDSITQAASTGGSLGADAPQNSWSVGWSSSVHSHAERLVLPQSNVHNLSVSGAKVTDFNVTDGQIAKVVALDPDPGYLTVLIGGNDLCTDTVTSMTSESAFETAFTQALSTIYQQSPGTYVYVVSIPDVYQLWKLFKNNFWARFIWSSADICQSLLANPTSTQKVDEDRRLAVRARNQAYNAIMARVCDSAPIRDRCRHDQGVVFATQLVASDVSGDYFHPSASGQARLAEESWKSRYSFGTPVNQAPTASFTSSCSGLTCSFDASASTDDGGITGYAWNFGDNTTGSGVTTSRTYAAGGTYSVTLTVRDSAGLTNTKTSTVSPQTVQNQAPTASFTSSCSGLTCSFDASASTDDGGITGYAWNFGDNTTGSGVTTSRTYAAGGTYSVALTVTDAGGLTNTKTASVTAQTPPTAASIYVSDLVGVGVRVNRNQWRADVTATVIDTTGAAVSDATVSGAFGGSAKSCVTRTDGTCVLVSDNIRNNVASVTFTLTNVTHTAAPYDSTKNFENSVLIGRP